MKTLLALAIALALVGCTTFHVEQTDESPGERLVRSDIKATAWFSSAQSVAKLKALQTDKSQSFGTEAMNQQGATNTAAVLQAIANILQATRPVP